MAGKIIVVYTVEDAEAIVGRKIAVEEISSLQKTLEHPMAETFAEVVEGHFDEAEVRVDYGG